jgi:hypothetical protein
MAASVTGSESKHKKAIAASLRRFKTWIDLPTMSVLGDELRAGGVRSALSKEDIETLLSLRLLMPRRNSGSAEMYWFSHPDVAPFVTKVLQSRRGFLRVVNSAVSREIAEAELEKKVSNRSPIGKRKRGEVAAALSAPLGFKYHLLDLLGAAILTRIPLPVIGGHQRFLISCGRSKLSIEASK